jgi:23S rRNA pseudouridine2457 synthase
MVIAFNKPYGIVSQFTAELPDHRTLAEFGFPPRVYPVGRLDRDSEGLLILSDEAWLVRLLLEPARGHPRTYWAQVELVPSAESLARLERGIRIGGYQTRPCRARLLPHAPPLPPRIPPIRYRKNVPDAWVEITLTEGKYRQVRRMLAAIGHPVLRLVRVAIGKLALDSMQLEVGQWRILSHDERERLLTR